MTQKINKFKQIVKEVIELDNIRCLLQWDQETYMPIKAGKQRGQQIALLSRLAHQIVTSEEYQDLLLDLLSHKAYFSIYDQKFLEVKKRSYDLAIKLSQDFISEMAEVTTLSQQAWVEAKRDNNFEIFEPHLARIIELNRVKAKMLNPTGNLYEVLLDTFETGLSTEVMDNIFVQINPVIRSIIANYSQIREPSLSLKNFDVSKQKQFSHFLLELVGYDFEQGNLAEVVHPFMIRTGQSDVRVTNNYTSSSLTSLFSALHEGGHALFEQGFSQDYSYLLSDDERSLGVHESQSRFWENIMGRSSEFWVVNYPKLQEKFGFTDTLDVFLGHINYVKPSFVRIESDEVTYNLHIQIRYELEKMLISGSLSSKEVPEAWNQKYQDYLGITPTSNSLGCLQDVHWSHGTIGYFPTYTLGNIIAGQFWYAYKKYDSNYQQTILQADFWKILSWSRKNIHAYGPLISTSELVETVSGQTLSPQFFIDYLTQKYL